VFKSGVSGTRKDIVTASGLLDISKSLELGGVNNLHTERMKLNTVVHWIVNYLKECFWHVEHITGLSGVKSPAKRSQLNYVL